MKHTHVQMVQENMKFYAPREIKRAKLARDLLASVGSPSVQDLKTALATNAIANVPVTTSDVELAEQIFGPDIGSIKGKTTRRKPIPMVSDQIAMPPELCERRSTLELCIDIMFVNEMAHLTSITRALHCRTAQCMATRMARDVNTTLDNVLRMHNSYGFIISKICCDGEFRPLMDPIKDELDIEMQHSPAQAHVPEAEWNIRTIKERVRAAYHHLPYKALPKIIMRLVCWRDLAHHEPGHKLLLCSGTGDGSRGSPYEQSGEDCSGVKFHAWQGNSSTCEHSLALRLS